MYEFIEDSDEVRELYLEASEDVKMSVSLLLKESKKPYIMAKLKVGQFEELGPLKGQNIADVVFKCSPALTPVLLEYILQGVLSVNAIFSATVIETICMFLERLSEEKLGQVITLLKGSIEERKSEKVDG